MDQRDQEQLTPQAFGSDSAGYYLWKAMLHAAHHEAQGARTYYDSARIFLEPGVRKQPGAPWLHSALGRAYAGLGRKDEAIREGRQAVAVVPISLDHYSGPLFVSWLAEIYVMVGEYDAAIDQIAIALSVPGDGNVTVPLLRIDPIWTPLRGNPRFEALLNSKRP
jgi:tetratricopeptide (TPR) repeat protein